MADRARRARLLGRGRLDHDVPELPVLAVIGPRLIGGPGLEGDLQGLPEARAAVDVGAAPPGLAAGASGSTASAAPPATSGKAPRVEITQATPHTMAA